MELTLFVLSGLALFVVAFLVMITIQVIRIEKIVESIAELTEASVTRFYNDGGN